MDADDELPGEPAMFSGRYAEYDRTGEPTGWTIYADEGGTLPTLHQGFTWRHVPGTKRLG